MRKRTICLQKKLCIRQAFEGYPTAIFTAIVASAMFATLSNSSAIGWRIATAFLGLLTSILVAAQAFGKFYERSETHRDAAVEFGAIRLELEQFIANGFSPNSDIHNILDEIRYRILQVSSKTPAVANRLWKSVSKRASTNLVSASGKNDLSIGIKAGEPQPMPSV
jgi:flagellar basal body-associated protein FliL